MTRDEVWDALATVIDPELGMDIVELGLVYELELNDQDDVSVLMTLTTEGCPMHDAIVGGVHRALDGIGARSHDVELTFDPPWSPDRIGTTGWDSASTTT